MTTLVRVLTLQLVLASAIVLSAWAWLSNRDAAEPEVLGEAR